MFYETAIKVTRTQEDGANKKMLERYVVKDCLSFSEAESRSAKMYSEYSIEGEVVAVRRSNIYEVVNENDTEGKYFKAKLASVFVDDKGKEKMTYYHVLVNAKDMDDANKKMQDYMRQGMEDLLLMEIKETKIMEVI